MPWRIFPTVVSRLPISVFTAAIWAFLASSGALLSAICWLLAVIARLLASMAACRVATWPVQGGEIGRVVVVVGSSARDLAFNPVIWLLSVVFCAVRVPLSSSWLVERGDLALDRGLLLQFRARGAQAPQSSIERAHAVLGHLARIAVVEAGLVRVAAEAHLVGLCSRKEISAR